MEALFRRLEGWGYPASGLDWLRKRRLLVVMILAAVSWIGFLALFWAAYFAGGLVLLLVGGSAGPGG